MPTLLYVEDDDDNAFMLTQRLRRHGIEIRHVEDGEKALVSAAWDRPDAILLDINLPGIDGLAVLRRLRADPATSTLPVIVVSASVLEAAMTSAMEAGANAFIAKPIDFAQLLDALSRVIPGASVPERRP
jgi:CheY-like chemotaxis protein